MSRLFDINAVRREISSVRAVATRGRVTEVTGPTIRASLSGAAIGDMVIVERRNGAGALPAQVVGFANATAILSPFGPTEGIFPGGEVTLSGSTPKIFLSPSLLGSIVDSLGNVLYSANGNSTNNTAQNGRSALTSALRDAPSGTFSIAGTPPHALRRAPIQEAFVSGIRAIDSFITLGRGQRLGIFAEPGVGKSTLLGMLAKNSSADVTVIGLIGERGREVGELLFDTLDEETRRRTVAVVSTSDEAAVCRVAAASTATRIAEYFRDLGLNVLLQMDSLTRLFRAMREVGLAAGELPVRRGYPPSVFAELPRLLERAGTAERGSITALYTVLLSSDLDEDPMVEEVKGLTDGHLVLRRELAERSHYPAIDVLASISRVQSRVLSAEALQAQRTIRRIMSRLANDRELVLLGSKSDAELDRAMALEPQLKTFLTQRFEEAAPLSDTLSQLQSLASNFAA